MPADRRQLANDELGPRRKSPGPFSYAAHFSKIHVMRVCLSAFLCLFVLIQPTHGQDFGALELQCADETASPAATIDACGQLIDQAAYTDLQDYAIAHFRRGTAYRVNGEDALALEDFEVALDYDPYDYAAYIARGDVLLSIGNAYRAIADFTVAAGLEPLEPEPYVRRAIALQANREYAQAVDDLRFALRLDETHTRARRVLAWLLSTSPQVGLRNGPEAINLTSEIDQENADIPDLMILAAVLAEVGDIDASIEVYKSILDRDGAARARFVHYLSITDFLGGDEPDEPTLETAIRSCLQDGCRIGGPRSGE